MKKDTDSDSASEAPADVARGLLADLGGGHARVEVRETDGHLAAAAGIAAHRPPRAHETPEPVPAVMLGSTEPLGRKLIEDAADPFRPELAGMKTVASVRKRQERRQLVMGVGVGVVAAVGIVSGLLWMRGGDGAGAGADTDPGVATSAGAATAVAAAPASSGAREATSTGAPAAVSTGAEVGPGTPASSATVAPGPRASAKPTPTDLHSATPPAKPAPAGSIQEPDRTF